MPQFARALQADAARLGRAGRPARQNRPARTRRSTPPSTTPTSATAHRARASSVRRRPRRQPSERHTDTVALTCRRARGPLQGPGDRACVRSQVVTAYYRELLSNVRPRPRMYLLDGSFAAHTAFITGLAAGAGWMPLQGFREFLLTKIGTESRIAWPRLVRWPVEPIGHNDTKPWQPRSRPRRGGHDQARRTAGRVPRDPRPPRRTDTDLRRVPRHAPTPRRQLRRLTEC